MPDGQPTAPLDFALLDDLIRAPGRPWPPAAADPKWAPGPERRVEISNVSCEDLAAAEAWTAKLLPRAAAPDPQPHQC